MKNKIAIIIVVLLVMGLGNCYATVVTDSSGNYVTDSSNDLVTDTNAPSLLAPSITAQPSAASVTAPATATFSVTATGYPAPTYQWKQEALGAGSFTAISGATSASYTTPATTAANNGTQYECIISNPLGTVTSNAVTLTVYGAPVITTQPGNLSVVAPATATFTVVAAGNPTPTYQWKQEVPGGGSFTTISGATSSSYTTPATTTANSGTQYECVVTNSSGNVTSAAATLTVDASAVAPTITTQPTNATVVVPATATFTVTATGVPAPTYQWQQEAPGAGSFTAISGATSASYTTPATTTSNNGTQYECVVSNSAGNVTSTAATLTVNYSVTTQIQSTSYNANGQITQIQYGNGTTTAYTYNPLNLRLMRIYTTNAQATVIQDLNYTYDSVGQVLSIVDNVNTGSASMNQTFAYDALNRLTSASGSYGSKTYAYDSIGNITSKDSLTYNYAEANSRVNGSGTPIGAAGPHAVTSLSDGTTFKYDANGNMVSLSKGSNLTQYVYDSQNRLQSVSVGGLTAASYTYDGDGGRTEKTVIRRDLALYNDNVNLALFGNPSNTPPLSATAANTTSDTSTYVGNVYEQETAATNGSPRSTDYIFMGSTRVASVNGDGNAYYYHTDNLGGTNVLTDSTGLVREFTSYDPFGQVFTHEKYGAIFATAWWYFTGKPLDDETGLIFLGSRYYNPSLGRFITPDTVVQAPSNPQTLNRYTYCNNNPVNLVDPTGHSWWSKFWHSVAKVFESFAKAVVEAVAFTVLSPFLTPIGAGLLVGAIAGGLGNGGGWSWSGALIGGALGAVGGAAFGSTGVNGFLGSAGTAVGWGLVGAGAIYSGVTGGVQGLANFGASVAGGMVGYAAGSAINKALAGTSAGEAVQEGQQVQSSSGAKTPIGQQQQSPLTVSQGENVTNSQATLTTNYDNEGQPVSFNLTPSSNSSNTFVIGETGSRVEGFALANGYDYYQPTPGLSFSQTMDENEGVIIDRLNAGSQIYDMDLDVSRSVRGPFYAMENETIAEWSSTTGKTVIYASK